VGDISRRLENGYSNLFDSVIINKMVSKRAARWHAAETRAPILDKSPYSRYYIAASYKGFTARSVITYCGDGDGVGYDSAAQGRAKGRHGCSRKFLEERPAYINSV